MAEQVLCQGKTEEDFYGGVLLPVEEQPQLSEAL